jgi:predicted dehydrogenase
MTSPQTQVQPVRWGILATGKIARTFVADLELVPGAVLAAVGSRTVAGARAFVDEHGFGDSPATAHGSYADLASDPDVDVVYVATPHSRHFDDVMTCLEAGKAVLCEKPLTLDADTASDLVRVARERNLFLAEAMWMRTNPSVRKAVAMAHDGHLGTVRQVRADLGFTLDTDPDGRLWNPELGASALLDLGIYPLTFATLVLGSPSGVAAAAVLSDRGVDVNGGATLTYDSGAVAVISWSQTAWTDTRASIAGDGGRIELPMRFHESDSFTYARNWDVDTIETPLLGRGYTHEAEEVMRCLHAGLTESPLLPLDGTLENMRLLDRIKADVQGRASTASGD